MKIWTTIIVQVFVDSAGTLLTAQGMKQVGEISTLQPQKLLRIIHRLRKNPFIWLGFLCQVMTFLLFLTVLSWASLSLVLPLGAIGYAVNLLGAQFLLNEKVTKQRWIGSLLICAGVALVSLSSSAK